MKPALMFIKIAIGVVLLSACTSIENSVNTVTISETVDSSESTEGTIVPSVTQPDSELETENAPTRESLATKTPEPNLPTPTLLFATDYMFPLNELLFEGVSDACKLPCWHNIVPGQTTKTDADSIVLSVFGIDSSETPIYEYRFHPSTSDELAQQYSITGYTWRLGETGSDGSFWFMTTFDNSEQYIALFQFSWAEEDSSHFKTALSVNDVIQALGVPSYMGASVETFGSSDLGGTHLLLLYSQGIVFEFYYGDMTFPVTPTDNPAIQDSFVEICTSTVETEPVTNVGYIVGDIVLMEPFPTDLTNLSPIQASVITHLIEFRDYKPIETIFGVSPKDIATQLEAGNDICLQTIIDD